MPKPCVSTRVGLDHCKTFKSSGRFPCERSWSFLSSLASIWRQLLLMKSISVFSSLPHSPHPSTLISSFFLVQRYDKSFCTWSYLCILVLKSVRVSSYPKKHTSTTNHILNITTTSETFKWVVPVILDIHWFPFIFICYEMRINLLKLAWFVCQLHYQQEMQCRIELYYHTI